MQVFSFLVTFTLVSYFLPWYHDERMFKAQIEITPWYVTGKLFNFKLLIVDVFQKNLAVLPPLKFLSNWTYFYRFVTDAAISLERFLRQEESDRRPKMVWNKMNQIRTPIGDQKWLEKN